MEGFYLLVGHLAGDYLLQWDYLAANKANPWPGRRPEAFDRLATGVRQKPLSEHLDEVYAWETARKRWWVGNAACGLHCLLYTLAVLAFSWWWLPAWGFAACLAAHFAIDRFALARRSMAYTGQAGFRDGPCAPWAAIVVDNTWHLLTLAAIAAAAAAAGRWSP